MEYATRRPFDEGTLGVLQGPEMRDVPASMATSWIKDLKTCKPKQIQCLGGLGWDVASSSARRPASLWVEACCLRWETLNPKY